MGRLRILLLYVVTTTFIIHGSRGCTISGVSNWLLPQHREIFDIHDGVIFNATTTNIQSIIGVTHREGLNGGPYIEVAHIDSELIISTSDTFINFENYETVPSMGFSINFRCSDGSSVPLVFNIDVIDTNNNDPVFDSTSYEYTLPFPIPPNYSINNCINDLFVRDIDLTTERIDFTLEGSTLFEISYGGSTVAKEFTAILRTTTFIRSITEPILLTITATDVDRTGDPRRTTSTTVTILADSEFSLPEEPSFSHPFYIATYTREHDIILTDSITLSRGYDSQVIFSLDGQFSEYFKLSRNENQVTLSVETELDLEAFEQNEIYLIVKAERDYTSGATATIILQLPEARELIFEKLSYSGTLEMNIVNLEDVILNVGFNNDVLFRLTGRFAELFNIINYQNRVVIETKEEISENILQENNFLVLTLIASAPHATTASTTIFLEIKKDDYVTPVFSENIYSGMYVSVSEVTFPNIVLTQGYDETVTFRLEGEYANYFTLSSTLNNVILNLNSTIPKDVIFNEKVLLFNILAEKPRTVGANTAIALKFGTELTEATILKFSKSTYNGQLYNGELTVEDIILESGYTPQITFTLNGDFEQNFTILNTDNVVKIALSSTASIEDLALNRFVVLEIEATGERAVPVITSVIIDIPEIEIVNPMFSRPFYSGSYSKDKGLEFTEKITLQKGYDSNVLFSLEGEHSQWFTLQQNENLVVLISNQVNPLPQDILDQHSNLIFAIVANKPNTIGGRAAIHIDLPKETIHLQFEKNSYTGRIENGYLHLEEIRLHGVAVSSVELNLVGDYESHFEITIESGAIVIRLLDIPEEVIENNNVITLNLEASQINAIKGHTTIVLDIIRTEVIPPIFEQPYYFGKYSDQEGLSFPNVIRLVRGFDEMVSFELEGDSSQWFNLVEREENSFTLTLKNENLHDVTERDVLVFTAVAHKNNTESAHATIVVSLKGRNPTLKFEQTSYVGSINNNVVILSQITLSEGYYENVSFTLDGETDEAFDKVLYDGKLENGVVSHETITISGYSGTSVEIVGAYQSSFQASVQNGIVTVSLSPSAPPLPADLAHVPLTLQAGRASTVLLLDVVDSGSQTEEAFDKVLYSGRIEDGVVSHEAITISGYSGTTVQIVGELQSSFQASVQNGFVTVSWSPSAAPLPADLAHVPLTLQAGRAGAVLLLDVVGSGLQTEEAFDKVLYSGRIEDGVVSHEAITILGYSGTTVQIVGELQSSFQASVQNGFVTVSWSPSAAPLPADLAHVPLTLQAGRAGAVLLLDVVGSGSQTKEAFDKVLYSGRIEDGVVSHEAITILGYSGTTVQIVGEYQSSFQASVQNGIVTVSLSPSAPPLPADLAHVPLTLQAGHAGAVLLLDVVGSGSQTEVAFDKVLYSGRLEDGVVSHETITISGYSGTNVQIVGEYQSSFQASVQNGIVTVSLSPSAPPLPADLAHVPLTLQAGRASTVLLLDVISSGTTNPPDVTFSKSSYFLWADVEQTGVVGRVEATASNNEAIAYSLQFNDDFLQDVITINNEGEILLSDSIQSGVHSFTVIATTQNSRATATASVLLRVEALPKCDSEIGLQPLIVLEILEEQPHENLVVFNEISDSCQYKLSNSWPADQSWLYIDNKGLHSRAIDREDQSIAFMTLSQIQVELILSCDSDVTSVAKRSLNPGMLEPGSYNYGSNKWILADTIEYNPRRSLVNLIVNDINDNPPIFIGKETEPIYVGFPEPELEDMILPRALVELKATDADIGENAALMYWSSEEGIAVAPRTGFVHVRNNARLENNSRFTVYATDLNGRGRNGTLDIVVKILDINQIAVVTVQSAFLDDESSVLNDLSEAVGYQVKVLRGVVISQNNVDLSRTRRNSENIADISLQLYIYGIHENEPVNVVRLTRDINNSNAASVNIARVLSLEDHLESLEICPVPERDIGLLVATIVLAVLLFIIIVTIILYFVLIRKYKLHLKWRKNDSYNQFDDNNSDGSRSNTIEPIPKVDILSKPRLDIEELKRSERRLQERLNIPIVSIGPEINVKDVKDEPLTETIVDISTPVPQLPIVIQSIDKLKDSGEESDEDEFGEKKGQRKKSVVTFNENVEKIIHLDDLDEPDTPEPTIEVYKF